ncbi:Hypothetical protein, putative [Bodo saltans]|uniref:Uncharacterized protein n=1 Tax=Bodo saltans TaxID=75058 RepID=A0A0S4IPN9_BODSA|nr:Hypothetical protein, putative [Bodo saltans]|eukprot:CUF08752.1 Hypothetical protein, putative [Bodo saltans]
MKNPPGVSSGQPPHPTSFTDVRDEDWAYNDWRDAKAAVALFPEGSSARKALNFFRRAQMIPEFKEQYARYWNELPVNNLSPVDYYKVCIEKRKKCNVITVKFSKMTSQFVASTATVTAYKNRMIFSDTEESCLWTMEPLAAAFVGDFKKETRLPNGVNFSQLHVVSGESGTGKTTYGLMTAEFGICVTPKDIKDSALNSLNADDRNPRVLNAVKGAIEDILGDLFPLEDPILPNLKGKAVTMSLVLDEFGKYPAFVRGLCAVQDDVRKLLQDIIPFDVNVKILVIGTGTDIKSDGIGSQPTKCVALRMSDAQMLHRITTALKKRYGDRAATLESALECHFQAQHLIYNPRFAACLFRRIVDFCGPPEKGIFPLFNSKEAALVALDMLLVVSAQDYKLLSGMNELDKDDVARSYKIALELLLRDVHDVTDLTEDEVELLTSKGVLEDCSLWVKRSDLEKDPKFVAITGKEHKVKDEAGKPPVKKVLAAPQTGRYKMSMAQQLLFRMCYGFHVLESAASWQRYEVQIAEHTTMLLSGLEGRPLHELLGRLGWPKRAKKSKAPPTKRKSKQKATKPVDRVLLFDTVTTIHSKGRIEPTTSHGQLKALYETCVSNGESAKRMSNAVVIVNGTGAQYADVIVVIPKIAVILIQCKFYGENSTIKIEAEDEKLKAEIGALRTLAGVPRGAYFRVLATPQTLEKVNLKSFHLLSTNSTTSLAPLFTPVYSANVPANEEYKVVLSLKGTRIGTRAVEECE